MKTVVKVEMENAVRLKVLKIRKVGPLRSVLVETQVANEPPTEQWLYVSDIVNVNVKFDGSVS